MRHLPHITHGEPETQKSHSYRVPEPGFGFRRPEGRAPPLKLWAVPPLPDNSVFLILLIVA